MNYVSLICILKLEQILMSLSFLKQKILKSPGDKYKHKHTAFCIFMLVLSAHVEKCFTQLKITVYALNSPSKPHP